MIRATTFAGRRVAVFGLGGSGLAAARSLVEGGAEAIVWDDSEAGRDAARQAGFAVADLAAADWKGIGSLVLAPGVPLTHPEPHWVVKKARESGAEVIGDIEIFFRERAAHCPDAPVVCITGTNGKSTTTALITHILRSAGRDAQMGGNIGKAILTLEPPSKDRVHVIEISSFQIDLTPSLKPTVGVLLNVTPDHLDRHGPADDLDRAMSNYAAIKERLVATAGHAVVGVDDPLSEAIYGRRAAASAGESCDVATPVSVTRKLRRGVFLDGATLVATGIRRCFAYAGERPGMFVVDDPGTHIKIAGLSALRGRHNAQNIAMAYVAARCLGVVDRVIERSLASFPGLPHRMEEVGRSGRILFINDSKATNADSTEKALSAFPSDVYWIAGGKPKEGGIASLSSYFPRIAKAYLIGAATDAFAATLGDAVAFERCGTLDVAVAAAARDALAAAASGASEPVVLLSPACASYDQFKNFEQRGDAFRSRVAELPGVTMRERAT